MITNYDEFFTTMPFGSQEDNSYVIKYGKTPILIDNQEELEKFGQEMNELAHDPNKNEKLAVYFRTIDKNNNQIIERSVRLDQKTNGNLLVYEDIVYYLELYQKYIEETYGDIYNLEWYIDIVKIYYPLDKKNKIENISREDKYLVTCYSKAWHHHSDGSWDLLREHKKSYTVEEESVD